MTCQCNKLPKGFPWKHLCKDKTAVNKRSRAQRWMHPKVCVKQHQSGPFIQLTAIQSTLQGNLIHTTGVNSNSLYVPTKERCKGVHVRWWATEIEQIKKTLLEFTWKNWLCWSTHRELQHVLQVRFLFVFFPNKLQVSNSWLTFFLNLECQELGSVCICKCCMQRHWS